MIPRQMVAKPNLAKRSVVGEIPIEMAILPTGAIVLKAKLANNAIDQPAQRLPFILCDLLPINSTILTQAVSSGNF